ncbi:MAG: ABC transporter permease, partial [Bacteroides sp.]|nr:ABC transporter permease [Bacteroides sp.]
MKQIVLAIGTLLKFKAYTLINILGLALSLACVFTIARYIHQENTVNRCFPEYDRICMVKVFASNGEHFMGGYQSGLEEDPAVEQYTAIYQQSDMALLFGKQEIRTTAFSVDSTFFKLFPYKVIAGSGKIVRPRDVIITRSFWEKRLGGRNVIGATFQNSNRKKFTIVGIVDDPATKTSWNPELFMSDELDEFLFYQPIYALLMTPGMDIRRLNEKYFQERPRSKWSTYEKVRYQYLPLKEWYYDSDHGSNSHNY